MWHLLPQQDLKVLMGLWKCVKESEALLFKEQDHLGVGQTQGKSQILPQGYYIRTTQRWEQKCKVRTEV